MGKVRKKGEAEVKVNDLDQIEPGARVRVTRVAPSEAEHLGYVDDTARLTGQTGTVKQLVGDTAMRQLWVEWDNPAAGRLMLAGEDEVEVL
jgi:hypothetical protein